MNVAGEPQKSGETLCFPAAEKVGDKKHFNATDIFMLWTTPGQSSASLG